MPEILRMNPIDVFLAAIVVLFAVEGLRRGLFLEALDLIVLAASGLLALQSFQAVGAWLSSRYGWDLGLAELASFLLIFCAFLLAFAVVTTLVTRAFDVALQDRALRLLNSGAGLAPGVVKGIVMAALALRAMTLLPLGEDVQSQIAQSRMASRVNEGYSIVLPYVEEAFDKVGGEVVRFVPPIHGSERKELDVPKGITVWADPDSEAVMLKLLNQERALAGLPAVVADERLRSVARAHSEEMFRLSYFSHESPVTGSPFDRLRRANVPFRAAGENLAYAPTVEIAHRGLMNSPEHRKNILSPDFRRVGIGVVRSGLWGRMFTQNFGD